MGILVHDIFLRLRLCLLYLLKQIIKNDITEGYVNE